VNVPSPAGTNSADFRMAFGDVSIPRSREFQPDFSIISAGFDAHAADPSAHSRSTTADFGWATRQLLQVAEDYAGNRVVSVLEGGYDLRALAASVREHVRASMGLQHGIMADSPPDIAASSFEDALAELDRIVRQSEEGRGKLD
ncbi:hypothetical protein OY671_010970, partial [Metschnikowia pulcherrima]